MNDLVSDDILDELDGVCGNVLCFSCDVHHLGFGGLLVHSISASLSGDIEGGAWTLGVEIENKAREWKRETERDGVAWSQPMDWQVEKKM